MDNVTQRKSRKQALADGEIIDVSKYTGELGFPVPVAVTSKLWKKYVELPEYSEVQNGETKRLREILTLFMLASNEMNAADPWLTFFLIVQAGEVQQSVSLKACLGPGDGNEPVITLMPTNEHFLFPVAFEDEIFSEQQVKS